MSTQEERLRELAREAIFELKSYTDDAREADAVARETAERIERTLHAYEDQNAKRARDLRLAEKSADEYREMSAALERKLLSLKAGTQAFTDIKARLADLDKRFRLGNDTKAREAEEKKRARGEPEYKAFFTFFKARVDELRDVDFKTLRTDGDGQGGYLIPQILDNSIRKDITEISPIRAYARTRIATGKSLEMPRRLAILDSHYEGEAQPSIVDNSLYGSETVTLYRQTVTVPATLDMMVSTPFDLEREIASDVGETFAWGEGKAATNGAGIKGPQGITVDSRVETVLTKTTGEIDFGDLAEIVGHLKRGYRPLFHFNRRTLAKLWQINSSIGVPIWQPAASTNASATIWGIPYDSRWADLDDAQTGSNAKVVIFGDLRRAYEVFDLIGMSVVRDDLTRKKEAITEWTFRRYTAGRIVIPEAVKVLKIR